MHAASEPQRDFHGRKQPFPGTGSRDDILRKEAASKAFHASGEFCGDVSETAIFKNSFSNL